MSDYIGGKAWKQEKHDRIVQAAFKQGITAPFSKLNTTIQAYSVG